jgi:hypothetical protein
MNDDNKPVSTGSESDKDHDDQHTNQIIVNGRARQVSGKELTFVQVVNLAFDDAVFNDITVYTITFKGGEGHKPEGTLVEGESVKIKKGMVFNVKRTDKS